MCLAGSTMDSAPSLLHPSNGKSLLWPTFSCRISCYCGSAKRKPSSLAQMAFLCSACSSMGPFGSSWSMWKCSKLQYLILPWNANCQIQGNESKQRHNHQHRDTREAADAVLASCLSALGWAFLEHCAPCSSIVIITTILFRCSDVAVPALGWSSAQPDLEPSECSARPRFCFCSPRALPWCWMLRLYARGGAERILQCVRQHMCLPLPPLHAQAHNCSPLLQGSWRGTKGSIPWARVRSQIILVIL